MNATKDEQYCLRWNDHRNTLLKNFERLLQTNTLVDCTLAAEGQYLKAHKVVLSACSPYLEAVLNCDVEKHPIIFMKDMKFQELKAIMVYMYRGEVVIPHDQLAALLHAAESLQIKGLGCGDKIPETGSRRENIMQQKVPQPTPPPPPPPAQPLKQQHTAPIRVVERTRVQHEALPQVVDLTDDRAPAPAVPVARTSLDSKRSMAQPAGRNKRMSVPERNVQGNITSGAIGQIGQGAASLAASLQGALFQANVPATCVIQNAFSIANVTSAAAAAAAAPTAVASPTSKQSVVVRKLSTSPGLRNDLAAPQIPSPVQHFDAQITGVTGTPLATYRPRVRMPLAQSTLIQSDALRTAQPGRPPILSPQRAIAVGNTNVAVTPEQTPSNRIPEAASRAVEQAAKVSTLQRSEIEEMETETKAVLSLDCEQPQTLPPVSSSSAEPEEPKAPTASDAAADDDEEALANRAGPVEQERAKKPAGTGARRGRPPAGERRFKCSECDKAFSSKISLDRHRRVHEGDCYNCDVCDKTFVARGGLVKHMRQHVIVATAGPAGPAEPTVSLQTVTRAAQALMHKCQLCGTTCSTAAELEKHLTDHSLSATDTSEDLLAAD